MATKKKLTKKIAISFSGEGWGHAARVVAISEKLQKHIEIEFWAPENLQKQLRQAFPKHAIHSLPLMPLVKKDHRVDYIRTMFANWKNLFGSQKAIQTLSDELKERNIDVVMSDYDPFLPKAARIAGLPILLVNHQGILKRYHRFTIESIMARIANHYMMPTFDEIIIVSFYDGDVGPVLRDEIRNAKITRGKHITVYAKETSREKVINALKQFPEWEFELFPDPEKDFVKTLASSRGIIAPGGHQMLSECLYLKKPVLSIPEIGQYEQRLNASMLEKTGYGVFGHYRTLEKEIGAFLSSLDEFPKESRKKSVHILTDDYTLIIVDKIIAFVERRT